MSSNVIGILGNLICLLCNTQLRFPVLIIFLQMGILFQPFASFPVITYKSPFISIAV